MFRIIMLGEHPALSEVVQRYSDMGEIEVVRYFSGSGEGIGSKEGIRWLQAEEVEGVVVASSLEERPFWCERALEAGKKVLCLIPPAKRLNSLSFPFSASGANPSFFLANPALYTSPGEEILFPDKEVGNLLFFDLKIAVPRDGLGGVKEGILLGTGLEFLSLIEENWGAVDSVWGRARSLVRNRSGEDMVVAHLLFKDGKEGVVQVNGLGGMGGIDLKLFGRRGGKEVTCVHWEADVGVWERVFRRFLCFLTGMGDLQREEKSNIVKGFRLMNWIVQATRFQREIFLNEVIHE
jgi:hypothetical protein